MPLYCPEGAAAQGEVKLVPHEDGGYALTLSAPPSQQVRDALLSTLSTKKDKEALGSALDRFELRHQALSAPSMRGVQFRPIPMFCIRLGQNELDLAERETLLDLVGFTLADQPADLPGFVPEQDRKPYLLDVDQGHLRIEQEQAVYAVNLDLVPTDVTEADLVRWLDSRLRQADTPQSQMLAWLGKALKWLQREKNLSLTSLVRHRNQLADALAVRLSGLRGEAQKTGLQLALLGQEPRGCVSADYVFRFGRSMYPARPPYYQGRYRFLKHYYGLIGDLKGQGEEYDCAITIDEVPQIRHWVRNIPRFPEYSFWLPTSSDRFYPDFVCELMDGRLLVVEYKGEAYKTNDDSYEKNLVGEFWAKESGNLFLMAVAKDESGRGVKEQLGVLLKTVGSAAVSFAEFARVRLLRDLESDGYRLKRDMAGTVVAIYGGGAAYAVEFAELDGGMAVVTVKAADLTRAVEQ